MTTKKPPKPPPEIVRIEGLPRAVIAPATIKAVERARRRES